MFDFKAGDVVVAFVKGVEVGFQRASFSVVCMFRKQYVVVWKQLLGMWLGLVTMIIVCGAKFQYCGPF